MMKQPPIMRLVSKQEIPASGWDKTPSIVEAMDSLDRAECRLRFLCEIFESIDVNNMNMSADGLVGLCMALRDVDMELAVARAHS